MLKIALTGGIGSGKTAVTEYLSRLGVPILDADDFSHQVTSRGEPADDKIAEAFGPSVRTPQGDLDRTAMRSIVFTDETKRAELEAIVHPRVQERMNSAADAIDAPYIIFSIPLLIETGQADAFDRVVVIEAPQALRAERVAQRIGLSEEEFMAIDRSQATSAERHQAADEIINNDGTLPSLHAMVDALHQHLLQLASATTPVNNKD